MKKTLALLALGIALTTSSGFTPVNESKLRVEVSGIKGNTSTNVWVSVFTENDFLEEPITRKASSVKNGKAYVEFDLPPGEYAISTYHDKNGNDELDRYFIGKPKEPYGFSNNVAPRFGPPGYEDCKFTLGASTKSISITLLD